MSTMNRKYDGLGHNKFNKIVSLFSSGDINDKSREEIFGNTFGFNNKTSIQFDKYSLFCVSN